MGIGPTGPFLGVRVAQWLEHLPPTNVAWVQILVSTPCGLSLLLVLSFAPRGLSPGTPFLPSL